MQKYTPRLAHLERGGVDLDLPSLPVDDAGEDQGQTRAGVHLVVDLASADAAPPQGDLASVGFEKADIANQAAAGDVGTGDRQGPVRNKRTL